MNKVLATALAGAALALTTPAYASINVTGSGDTTAATITSGTAAGDNFTITFDAEENGTILSGLSSYLTLTFVSASSGNYVFNYLLGNTSSTASQVTGFGFDTNPTINVGNSSSTGTFQVVSSGGMASNSLDICFKNNPLNNQCESSTGNSGVAAGATSTTSPLGQITLNFGSTTPDQITLSNFLDRYQGIPGPNGTTISAVGHPTGVPEPATWAMMLLGFGGIGMAMRRRRATDGRLAQVA
jgi:hypothetical protein